MPETTKELSGRTAVVTGSSSGIGRAIALELAGAGANVVVHARKNAEGAEETASQVRGFGVSANVLLADLADSSRKIDSCAMPGPGKRLIFG